MYLKRKVYALSCIAIWAFICRNFYILLANTLDLLPSTGLDASQALRLMYWCLPVWIILLVFWQISPTKDPFSGNDNMTRKQQKMIAEATRNQPPRF